MTTSAHYSPWDILPAPDPKSYNPPLDYFYDEVAKHLIKDTVKVMQNGLPIDLDRVRELEATLDTVLADVEARLAANPVIREFQLLQFEQLKSNYIAEQTSKLKSPSEFIKPFKPKDMVHRSYFMEALRTDSDFNPPDVYLECGTPKYDLKFTKSISHPAVQLLLSGSLKPTNKYVQQAQLAIATLKSELHNRSYLSNIETLPLELPRFNPASPPQKQKLFEALGFESEKTSKDTGLPSWDRAQVERLLYTTDDPDLKDMLQTFVDFSFAAIVRNNFIEAFYEYTVDGRLYGSYKLLGALSGRFTSQNPNMLNCPSTGSIYAKPIKKCLRAEEGFIVASIDFASLEDRVLASLTNDPGKCAIYEQDLDAHSFNSVGYYPEEVAQHMTLTGDQVVDAKEFKNLVDSGNKQLKSIRQKSKPVTFKCAYLGMPDSHKGGSITPEVYDNYHKTLYPEILKQVDNYIIPTLKTSGKIHLGLGFYLKSDYPDRDVRSVNNALSQFWSILSVLTINKMHQLIDDANLQDDIQINSTIYDSIYFQVRKEVVSLRE